MEMPGHGTITPEDVINGILFKALSLAPNHPAGSSTTYGERWAGFPRAGTSWEPGALTVTQQGRSYGTNCATTDNR